MEAKKLAGKNSGTFVGDETGRPRTKAEEAAVGRLTSHPDFKNAFGDRDYLKDPRFETAINAVVSGRSPGLVLADLIDRTPDQRPNTTGTGDGTGWAW
ncbi:hypothetical protein HY418_01550 [Candidatus Kaiserbacteria bacterium]|nr:hypothetical protein [Candidatus Kaiserbacteria bacterium]